MMHYAKRIARAHRTLRNRLGILRSLIDDWPLDGRSDDKIQDLSREKLKSEVSDWDDRIASLQHTATFAETERARENAAANADVLRERIGRVELCLEALDESGESTVLGAIERYYREKLKIERYCGWHARARGMHPLRRGSRY